MTKSKLDFINSRHMRVGDRVIMQMDEEVRSWGRHGPKDGTHGTVIGKYRSTIHRSRFGIDARFHKPGVYEKDGVTIIHWDGHDPDPTVDDGISRVSVGAPLAEVPGFSGSADQLKRIMSSSRMSCTNIALIDQEEAARRRREEWVIPVLEEKSISRHDQEYKLENVVRIGDLPETRAWEGDTIYPNTQELQSHRRNSDRPVHLQVHSIHYKWIDREPHTYQVGWYYDDTGEYSGMGHTYIGDSEIARVDRGNVWKHYHGEPLSFESIQDEVAFAHGMGFSEELLNPKTGLYTWTKDEALEAIRKNYGQGFNMGGVLAFSHRISLYRFKDEDLARRLRATVLEGFGIAA